MVADTVVGGGVIGVAGGGSVWRYQDGAGWTGFGGAGVVALVYAYNSSYQETVFAQTSNGEIYERVSNQWVDTHGALVLGSMAANTGLLGANTGITGIAGGGSVWHFQDNTGWTATAAPASSRSSTCRR